MGSAAGSEALVGALKLAGVEGLAGPLVVAVSGGADSAGLAAMVSAMCDDVRLVHVNHHLQGAAARLEEAVRALGRALGRPVTVLHVSPQEVRARGGGVEAGARAARYAALASQVGRGTGLTAHTLDDRLETVVMRLVQGTSVAGLGGPGRQVTIEGARWYRPLLDARRQEVRQWVVAQGLPFVDDPMNADERRLRTGFRERVSGPLLALAEEGPHGVVGLRRSLERLAVDGEVFRWLVWERLREGWWRYPGGSVRVSREVLTAGGEAGVVGAGVAEVLRRLGLRPEASGVERVRRMLVEGGSGRLRLPGCAVVLGPRTVCFVPARLSAVAAEASLGVPGEVEWGCWRVRAEGDEGTGETLGAWQAGLGGPAGMELRVRRPYEGELLPEALGGGRLAARLASARWPASERVLAPVLEAGGQVLGVAGWRVLGGGECRLSVGEKVT